MIPLFPPLYHLLAPWEAEMEDHLFYLAYEIENTLLCQRLMKVYLHISSSLTIENNILSLYVQKTDLCRLQTLLVQVLRSWADR